MDDEDRRKYEQLIQTIGWFFFDLFILGYVEDPVTGNSFRFPGGMQWEVYVEVNLDNGSSTTNEVQNLARNSSTSQGFYN